MYDKVLNIIVLQKLLGGSEQNKSSPKTEAEFLDEFHSKVLKDFLLAIQSHLYIAHSLVRFYGTTNILTMWIRFSSFLFT